MKFLTRLAMAVCAVGVIATCLGFALQTSPRPMPSGVPGYTSLQINVPHRDAPIDLHVWYPAATGGTPEILSQNALFYGAWVRHDAPGRVSPAPVVVMSHGSGGNAPRLGWIAAALATAGMIVVAPNHPGTTSGDSDPHQTVRVWKRPQDLSAALDHVARIQPMGLTPDLTRVGALGYSLGGFSALGLAGVQVSKAAFMAYCDRNPDQLDCGWMRAAGVDFAAIDQSRYDAAHRDPRINVAVAIDPALPAAMTPESLARVALPVLILNLGTPATLPDGLRSDHVAAAIPGARYHAISGAHHFSALAECSGLGVAIIALAGDDNICSDFGHRPRAEIQSEMLRQIVPMLQTAFGLPG